MRIRIGTNDHNFRNYGHGRSQMSEFERLLHLIVSLQILFGSRRGAIWIPVVILAMIFGGLFFYNHMYNNPERLLATADRQWNTGIEREQIAAIDSYMEILEKKDGNLLSKILNPSQNAKRADEAEPLLKDAERRKELYSRIIRHKFRFVNPDDAAVWVRRAVGENISLTFIGKDGTEDEELTTFWKNATATLKNKRQANKNKKLDRNNPPRKNNRLERKSSRPLPSKPTPSSSLPSGTLPSDNRPNDRIIEEPSETKPGVEPGSNPGLIIPGTEEPKKKFDVLPGIDARKPSARPARFALA